MDGPAPKEQMSQTERPSVGLPPRPDLSPERKPEPLATTFTKLREQLSAIAMEPSKEQVSAVARKIQEEDKDVSLENARKRARRRFETYIRYQDQYLGANEGVRLSRSRAFDAPSGEFEARRQTYHDGIRARNESRQALSGMANWLRGAGLQLEPGQRLLTWQERAQKGAAEAGWGMAAAEYKTEQAIGKGVKAVGEGVKERWAGVIEGGRGTIKSLVEAGNNSVKQAVSTKEAVWNSLVNTVSSGYQKTAEGIKRSFVGGVWREVKQTFAGGRENIQEVGESLPELRADIRSFIGNSWEGFKSHMQALGEKAGSIKDAASQAISSFVSEQAKSVVDLEGKVQSRVSGELNKAVRVGKEFLRPAWESVDKDRQRIRAETSVLFDRLGLIVDQLAEKAEPITEPILDQGRDIRDGAFGWAKNGIEGMRAFGRKSSGVVSESPAWRLLSERWDGLRTTARGARERLNTFLSQFGRKVPAISDGEEAPPETSPMQKTPEIGKTIKEFFSQAKERVAKGFEVVHRYWEIYAVGKWQETGMNSVDIGRRLKLMRGVSAASLGRVASLSTAGAMEGAALAGRIVRDPRGRVLVGVAALGLALVSNPELVGNIAQFFQGADLSGLPQIDLSGIQLPQVELPRVEVPSVSIPGVEGATGTAQAPPSVSFPEAGVTQPVAAPLTQAPAPEIVTSGSQVGPGMEMAAPVVPTAPEVQTTPTATPVVEAVATPSVSISEAVRTGIVQGQPVEPQARTLAEQLPGNINENYYRILKETLFGNVDKFEASARTIANAPAGTYPSDQVQIAKEQLGAIAAWRQNPGMDESSRQGYDLLMKGMHFWSPR